MILLDAQFADLLNAPILGLNAERGLCNGRVLKKHGLPLGHGLAGRQN